jgi:hypothetical protein
VTAQRSENADGHRYYIHPVTGESMPSVTTIIEGTKNKAFLGPWLSSLTAKWCAKNAHLLAELGPEGFVTAAKDAAKLASEIKADAGTYAHKVIESVILAWADPANAGDVDLPLLPDHLGDAFVDGIPASEFVDVVVAGFHQFVEDHKPRFEAAEMTVFHKQLSYAGTADITANLRLLGSELGLLDVKTGKNVDRSAWAQQAAYKRGLECLMPMGDVQPMPAIGSTLLLRLRPEYASGYRLIRISDADDARGWNRFRHALHVFRDIEGDDGPLGQVVYPPLPDGSQPPMRLCDLEGYGPTPGLLAAGGLSTVADVFRLDLGTLLAIDGIGPARAKTALDIWRDFDPTFTDDDHAVFLAALQRGVKAVNDLEGAA